ncbi:MAG: hypothetical protein HYZ72_17040 [Deltaproteobacteria bacterium]|nr:hypothetical protein [Deltaproteobacteria bacterium]
MALGKQTGQYSGKLTSLTLGPGPGNAMTGQANMEGTVSGERGEGTYALTHHVVIEPGAKSGTWSQYGFATMKDGTSLGFRGQGTWEEISAGKWRYRGTGQLSDGSTYATEFEGDWATRTWAGKLYEWS